MAEPSGNQNSLGMQIFRNTALQKMSSADDLDRYLKITNPSAWVLVGVVAALLIAAFIWGLTATLPLRQTTTGVVKDGQIICFLPLEDNALATSESKVTVAGRETRVVSVDDDPHSQREVAEALGSDYAVATLDLGQWSYKMIVAIPGELASWNEGDDVPVQITTKEVAPLSYLFGGAQS